MRARKPFAESRVNDGQPDGPFLAAAIPFARIDKRKALKSRPRRPLASNGEIYPHLQKERFSHEETMLLSSQKFRAGFLPG